jgi:hypothetical protein
VIPRVCTGFLCFASSLTPRFRESLPSTRTLLLPAQSGRRRASDSPPRHLSTSLQHFECTKLEQAANRSFSSETSVHLYQRTPTCAQTRGAHGDGPRTSTKVPCSFKIGAGSTLDTAAFRYVVTFPPLLSSYWRMARCRGGLCSWFGRRGDGLAVVDVHLCGGFACNCFFALNLCVLHQRTDSSRGLLHSSTRPAGHPRCPQRA